MENSRWIVVTTHLRRWIDGVVGEPLDVVERRKLAPVDIRWCEVGKLVEGLATEVVAIHQEQDALGAGVFQQAVGEVHRRKRLAGTRGHLNQRSRIATGEGGFE